ncbi:kinase [Micromonospora sp. URMC 107]|uniref:kinase n=1 Tax=Micromonospora sp. URMC 107 TaxID=3423418 RepID=UPI003F1BF55E
MQGVIFYGPPAAGKDTVTGALCQLDQRYTQFQRLKAGSGRTAGYRMTSEEHLQELRVAGEVIWENHRYGATYVVDRPQLLALLDGRVPVVHLGQPEAIEAVKSAVPAARWLVVYLWCPRPVAATRITARGTGDTEARLRAWDETEPIDADLTLNTGALSATEAAAEVSKCLEAGKWME